MRIFLSVALGVFFITPYVSAQSAYAGNIFAANIASTDTMNALATSTGSAQSQINAIVAATGTYVRNNAPNTSTSSNTWNQNIAVGTGFGYAQPPGSSTRSLSGYTFFIDSTTTASMGTSTTTGLNSLINIFSTYSYNANDLSQPGDELMIECYFQNGTAPTGVGCGLQSTSITGVAGVWSFEIDGTSSAYPRLRTNIVLMSSKVAVLLQSDCWRMSQASGSNNVTCSGETPYQLQYGFVPSSSATFNCVCQRTGGGDIHFVYMKVTRR